ncbi:hypothetical protein SDC9_143246 [bioreactor metagenome]|uniref:Uncharacterized protein n=1 Tax=bioreactor metagenome TaxID=1076179 RepID=A0A645E3H4_9ZZZZ
MLEGDSTGVERILFESCDTTSSIEYLISILGLKISTLRFANFALLSLLISSSVLPENIDPHTTSIQPAFFALSKNILPIFVLYAKIIKEGWIGKARFLKLNISLKKFLRQ